MGGATGVKGNTKGPVKGEVRPADTDAAQANPSVGRQIWDGVKREIPGVGAYYHGQDAIDAWNKGEYWSAAGSTYEAVENVVPIGKGVKLLRLGIKQGFKQLIKREVKKEAKEDAGGAVKGPCRVDKHGIMKGVCAAENAESHHIIPREFASQVGVSDDDGPAVCVPKGFHQKVLHTAFNRLVEMQSDAGEISVAQLMAIGVPLATKGANRKGCGPLIAAKTAAKFGSKAAQKVQTRF